MRNLFLICFEFIGCSLYTKIEAKVNITFIGFSSWTSHYFVFDSVHALYFVKDFVFYKTLLV